MTLRITRAMSRLVAAALSFGVFAAAPNARAQALPSCSTLSADNPVYMLIGQTQEPLVKALGKKLRALSSPITLVYRTAGSCTNIDAMYSGTKLTQNPSYIPADPSWDPATVPPQCAMDPGGVDLDIANSNVFVDACTQAATPANVGLFVGPVQAYVFIAPRASSQRAITAEEGYFAFGFPGGEGRAEPWTDPNRRYILGTTRSTLISLAAAIGVPAGKMTGTVVANPTDVLTSVAQSPDVERTIGIAGVELYDKQRATLRALAFRAFKQRYAYYPDSTATATDKANVRNGLYFPWSPTVYLARLANGQVAKREAKYVLDLIQGRRVLPDPGFEPLALEVEQGLIPYCAMKVARTSEGGKFAPYEPDEPCHCFFEKAVGQAAPSCRSCSDDSQCGGGKCRHTYCEAR